MGPERIWLEMVQMPPHLSGPFSTHLRYRAYCSFPICGLIWRCFFSIVAEPSRHRSAIQAGVVPGLLPFIRTPQAPDMRTPHSSTRDIKPEARSRLVALKGSALLACH